MPRWLPPGRGLIKAAPAAALAYSWWLAGTRPFSWEAGALTVVVYAAAVLLLVTRRKQARRPLDGPAAGPPGTLPRLRAWLVAGTAVLSWELVTLLSSPRRVWPTLSSLYDVLALHRPGKAAVVFCWMALGYGLFGR